MLVGNIDGVGGIISSNPDLLEITFKIDANGLLTISIRGSVIFCCKSKTFEQEENRLSEEEIKEMLRAAEEFAQQDTLYTTRRETKSTQELSLP